jgi:hypothetical protein
VNFSSHAAGMPVRRAFAIVCVLVISVHREAFAGQDPARKIDAEVRLMSWADVSGQSAAARQPDTTTDFFVRRARLVVQARLSDRIAVSFQLGQDNIGAKALTADGGITLKDAYVNFRATNAFQVAFGQFKIPFLRANLESGFNQVLVDRGTLPTLRPAREGSRDVGAMTWGNAGGVQYRVAMFDGSDQDAGTAGGDLRLTARVAHNWFARETGFAYSGTSLGTTRVLQIAAQADLQNSRVDPRDESQFRSIARDYRAYALEAFLDQPIAKWAVTADAAWFARDDNYLDDVTPARRLGGHSVQAALLLPRGIGPGRLQLALRREDWDTDRGPVSAQTVRTTTGGTYYVKEHARKVQVDYTVKREMPEIRNDELRLSVVLVF